MLYTSYFSKLDVLLRNGITPVAISLSIPQGINVLRYKKLAPTWDILRQYKTLHDWDLYTRQFTEEVLSLLTPMCVVSDLRALTGDAENIAMLCWEKGRCHRHLVASWLNAAGIECVEWR